MLEKDSRFFEHARRAASAVSVLALFSSMIGVAYADGKYTAQMLIPGGQASQCANTPKTVELTVAGGKVTTAGAKCVGELQADGSFKCSFKTSTYSTSTFSGRVSGSNIEGTYQRVITPLVQGHGGGYSCHATFKGSAS